MKLVLTVLLLQILIGCSNTVKLKEITVIPPKHLIQQVTMPLPPTDSLSTNLDLFIYIEDLKRELLLQDSANNILLRWIAIQQAKVSKTKQ